MLINKNNMAKPKNEVLNEEATTPIQGNDPRQNCEKPATTYQVFDGKENNLQVHLSDDPKSPLYFNGIPEMYKNGAVRNDNKSDHFVGDDDGEFKA